MGLDTKHRPKKFDDVIGQEVVVTILKSSVLKKKYSSAYLFSGPSGTGKTTIARVFSKSILCESPQNGNPCNICQSCRLFDVEKNYGYMEQDAATVGGKEDMIKLKDEASFISTEQKKIIVLDECHDISKQGQDALLKQVEQCPDHLIYIFCTTEPNKIKPTLKKRCTQFQFSLVDPQLILNKLKYICESETIVFEEDALKMVADRSEGHVRDALKLLEEATYFGSVSVETIAKISVDYSEEIFEILSNLGKDLPKSLERAKKLSSYISVWEMYEQMLALVSDSVKAVYGYDDFLIKRKEYITKLKDIHGSSLIEFMNYLISRDKFVDRVGLQGDIILLHYKFCSKGFQPQIEIQKTSQVESTEVKEENSSEEQAASLGVSHSQLMAMPIKDRQRILREQKENLAIQEKKEILKINSEWPLPKEQRLGSDSFEVQEKEMTPLEFSKLLVGGRGG